MEERTQVDSQGKTSKISVGTCAYTDSLGGGNSHERQQSWPADFNHVFSLGPFS